MATATGERTRAGGAVVALLLVVAAGPALAAEVTLTAEVDRTEIAADEVVTLRARLTSPEAPTRWEFPSTPDFEILVEAPSQEHSVSLGGGGGVLIKQVYGVTRELRPKHAGTLTIPAITAVVRGRTYVAGPIVVKVSAAGSSPSASGAPGAAPPGAAPGGRAYHGWEKDLSLQLELDRREAYVGEQVVAEVWLLSPLDLGRFGGVRAPSLDGFWKEDLEAARNGLTFEIRQVHGVPTRAYCLYRVALFPTRAGDLELGPFEFADFEVHTRPPGVLDPGDVVRLTRRTAPTTLHVRPLPPGAPDGFEPVNVGQLSLQAAAAPGRVAVGEPFTVRVAATGDGNVRALSPPHLKQFPGTRAFPPTTRDEAGQRDRRLVGARTLETVLVPERSGELVIPSVEWPYFDPRAGKYQVARTPELRVTVVPQSPTTGPQALPGSNALAAGLRPIRSGEALGRQGPPTWQRRWFAVLLLAPPLAFLFLTAAGRLRLRGPGDGAPRRAGRSARRRMGRARRRLDRGDRPGFLAEVEHALLGYAADRLRRPAVGLTREALARELSGAGAHPPATRALLQALDVVDLARYGAGGAQGEEVLAAAERALSALEEADWQPEREVAT
jgi:HAMP domain-containing protein